MKDLKNFYSKSIFRWVGALTFLVCLPFVFSFAQDRGPRELVQVSGVVVANDSIQPVFYATVVEKNSRRGTISNIQGYFSFVAEKGDTLVFSAIGFQSEELAIPDTLMEDKMSVIQFMTRDTIVLPEAVIQPWPTKEEFKEAFLALEVPDDDYQRARKNLERERMREIMTTLAMDANENLDYQAKQYSQRLYYAGQYPPIQIFNPFAWAQFFKALKRGDFKKKKNRN